jgi:hypothetical protein
MSIRGFRDKHLSVPPVDASAAVDMLATFGVCLLALGVLMMARGEWITAWWDASQSVVIGAVCLVGALVVHVLGVKR